MNKLRLVLACILVFVCGFLKDARAQTATLALPGDLLPWIAAVTTFITGIVGGAFALWKWVYQERVETEKARAASAEDREQKQKEFFREQISRSDREIEQLRSELMRARESEKEATRLAHEAAHATPGLVKEAMNAALLALRTDNERLRASLEEARAALAQREEELSHLQQNQAAKQAELAEATTKVKELQTRVAVLEKEIEARRAKEQEIERVVILVRDGFFDPEIIEGMTANVFASVDAAARGVRAAAVIERMTAESLKRTRQTNERFRAREQALEKQEAAEKHRNHLRKPLPDPPLSSGGPKSRDRLPD
jgi:hypothetical protein